MKTGDKLYSFFTGKMKEVTFISEGLSDPSCKETVYFCRDADGRKFQCSKDLYAKTKAEAIQCHLKDLEDALPELKASVKTARESVKDAVAAIKNAKKLLRENS